MNIPKAIHAQMLTNNWLYVEFDNGEKRYLPSHYMQDYQNSWNFKEKMGKKRLSILVPPSITWLGTEVEIDKDGNLTVNGKDKYTSEEIWKHGKLNNV